MTTYLTGYESEDFQFKPCFHSIRVDSNRVWNSFPLRFIRDIAKFIHHVSSTDVRVVHFLAQYRTAAPRELACCWIAKVFRCKVLYEIKAGLFDKKYESGGVVYRWMIRRIVRAADAIGVEGRRYQSFLREEFDRESVYLPNICLESEMPEEVASKFQDEHINVLFVGYCYEGKGTFELVNGCDIAAKSGLKIRLVLAGQHSTEFAEFFGNQKFDANLEVVPLGKVSHQRVLEELVRADVFCLPTRHSGEGHNNSVNEALMNGCLVVCTRHGFLGDVLNEDIAVFLDTGAADEISKALCHIDQNRTSCIAKCENAVQFFGSNYVGAVVFDRVTEIYRDLLSLR